MKFIPILLVSTLVCISLHAQEKHPEATELYLDIKKTQSATTIGMPPSDAIVLFDGSNLSKWKGENGTPEWTIKEGAMEVKGGSGAIESKEAFADIQLHLEWLCPKMTNKTGQGYDNSGLFLMGLYEVQILNSYENETYSNGQAASIYKQYAPMVNASKAPGQWQTYDLVFTAPRFSEAGTLISPARITLFHNGILVQNNTALLGPTEYIGQAVYKKHAEYLPIKLQDHGDPVRFRNIWVRKL